MHFPLFVLRQLPRCMHSMNEMLEQEWEREKGCGPSQWVPGWAQPGHRDS